MTRRFRTIAGTLAIALSGCESSAPTRQTTPPDSEALTTNAAAVAQPDLTPNYVDREGDTYFYTSAVSDEDRRKGKAVGKVVAYRYFGQIDGMHRLESVREDGSRISLDECRTECRVIKSTAGGQVERIPFDKDSIIGLAFDDAINGRLAVAKPATGAPIKNTESTSIPTAFRGEWNLDVTACGTDLNDSRLRIEERRVRFYESDGEVTSVAVDNAHAITVNATYSGEGEVWKDSDRMVVSRSGNELSIDGVTRYRCP